MNPSLMQVMITAMDNAYEGITISDARQPDNPLIYVNKGFLKMTGLTPAEIIGKNCRFLQGKAAQQDAVSAIREAVRQQTGIQTEIINYRKDGTPFHNKLSITPVFDNEQNITHFIGIQEDVTALKEKEELEQKFLRQQLISQTTVEAQEQERDALGKELHDNINQLLVTAKLMLSTGLSNEELQVDMMQRSASLLNNAIEEIRMLSQRLVQPKLSVTTLQSSVEELIKTVQSAAPFTVLLQADLKEQEISSSKKLMLYRVIQEQLNNIIKHAMPQRVHISLKQSGAVINLSIHDDGNGFDPKINSTGIGLRNMKSRVEMENGCMCITSARGEGCRLEISVPL
jgi:PAS domain S-box-containing protein